MRTKSLRKRGNLPRNISGSPHPCHAHPSPIPRLHKPSGGAVVTLPNRNGGRRDVRLGVYDSPESRQEYYRVLAEWRAADFRPPIDLAENRLTVNEVLLAYLRHAEAEYGDKQAGETSSAGLARNTINRRVGGIKTMFKWAEDDDDALQEGRNLPAWR